VQMCHFWVLCYLPWITFCNIAICFAYMALYDIVKSSVVLHPGFLILLKIVWITIDKMIILPKEF
jgi:hypothetical protein